MGLYIIFMYRPILPKVHCQYLNYNLIYYYYQRLHYTSLETTFTVFYIYNFCSKLIQQFGLLAEEYLEVT